MNLKLKQLYLNRVKHDAVDDEALLSEGQPEPSGFDLVAGVVIVILVGIIVWLVIVSWMDRVSA